jgi:hypothetical protein
MFHCKPAPWQFEFNNVTHNSAHKVSCRLPPGGLGQPRCGGENEGEVKRGILWSILFMGRRKARVKRYTSIGGKLTFAGLGASGCVQTVVLKSRTDKEEKHKQHTQRSGSCKNKDSCAPGLLQGSHNRNPSRSSPNWNVLFIIVGAVTWWNRNFPQSVHWDDISGHQERTDACATWTDAQDHHSNRNSA